jgi:DNA-binding response OmpR family regulator
MNVLIVETNPELGKLWGDHLSRLGMKTHHVADSDAAVSALREAPASVIVLNLDLPEPGAMVVADYAAYRHPDTKVVFVTASTFFSDGSIFDLSPNAAAFVPERTAPEDLAAVVEYHARRIGPAA